VRFADAVDPALQALLFDPQTSGGLLIAVAADSAAAVNTALAAAGVPVVRIGMAESPVPSVQIIVRP
jgi:selenide, water dikinase